MSSPAPNTTDGSVNDGGQSSRYSLNVVVPVDNREHVPGGEDQEPDPPPAAGGGAADPFAPPRSSVGIGPEDYVPTDLGGIGPEDYVTEQAHDDAPRGQDPDEKAQHHQSLRSIDEKVHDGLQDDRPDESRLSMSAAERERLVRGEAFLPLGVSEGKVEAKVDEFLKPESGVGIGPEDYIPTHEGIGPRDYITEQAHGDGSGGQARDEGHPDGDEKEGENGDSSDDSCEVAISAGDNASAEKQPAPPLPGRDPDTPRQSVNLSAHDDANDGSDDDDNHKHAIEMDYDQGLEDAVRFACCVRIDTFA